MFKKRLSLFLVLLTVGCGFKPLYSEKEKANLRQSLQSMFDDHVALIESVRSSEQDILSFSRVMVDSLRQGGGIYWYTTR